MTGSNASSFLVTEEISLWASLQSRSDNNGVFVAATLVLLEEAFQEGRDALVGANTPRKGEEGIDGVVWGRQERWRGWGEGLRVDGRGLERGENEGEEVLMGTGK